jgi:hypothetical protein
MIVVAIAALFLGSIEPGRQWYRRWSYHRSQAAWLGRMEQRELARSEQERVFATMRDAIEASLMASPEFAAKSPDEQRRIVKATVEFHQRESKEARLAALGWREKRLLEETAAWWSWDPYAADVP